MSVTSQIDESAPGGGSLIRDGDDNARLYKVQVRERMNDLGVVNWGTIIAGQSAAFSFLTTPRFVGKVTDHGTSGIAKTLDLSLSNIHLLTLTGNCTITLTNSDAWAPYTFLFKQDGTGSRTITLPGTIAWSGGAAPIWTTTPSRTDMLVLLYTGAKYVPIGIGLDHNV